MPFFLFGGGVFHLLQSICLTFRFLVLQGIDFTTGFFQGPKAKWAMPMASFGAGPATCPRCLRRCQRLPGTRNGLFFWVSAFPSCPVDFASFFIFFLKGSPPSIATNRKSRPFCSHGHWASQFLWLEGATKWIFKGKPRGRTYCCIWIYPKNTRQTHSSRLKTFGVPESEKLARKQSPQSLRERVPPPLHPPVPKRDKERSKAGGSRDAFFGIFGRSYFDMDFKVYRDMPASPMRANLLSQSWWPAKVDHLKRKR